MFYWSLVYFQMLLSVSDDSSLRRGRPLHSADHHRTVVSAGRGFPTSTWEWNSRIFSKGNLSSDVLWLRIHSQQVVASLFIMRVWWKVKDSDRGSWSNLSIRNQIPDSSIYFTDVRKRRSWKSPGGMNSKYFALGAATTVILLLVGIIVLRSTVL